MIFLIALVIKIQEIFALQRFSVVSWRDSLDWKGISAEEITRRVLSKVQPGSIVLFHNAAEHTPEALPGIIEALQADGYTIVPISENIYAGDYTIDTTGAQVSPHQETAGSAQ